MFFDDFRISRSAALGCALVFVLFCFSSGSLAFAGEGRWEEPWGKASAPVEKTTPSLGKRVAEGGLQIFRRYISPVDGDRCPSYPTCSQYAVEAVRKHGPLIGLVMAFDRLIHEADEVHLAPAVRVNDEVRAYDPLENNDFWWHKKGKF